MAKTRAFRLNRAQVQRTLATAQSLGSSCSLTGSAGGNMRSYIARASRIKRARSSSDFGTNCTTSPMYAPGQEIRNDGMTNIMPSRSKIWGAFADLHPPLAGGEE